MRNQQSMSPAVQPFHILKKDARHLWPETLVSIALLIALAWVDVQTWIPADSDAGFNPATFGAGILKLLLPVSWLVLTSRLVHDEELVGDRQFWTTRPYTWYSLLASKILYLLLFVCVPFVIMQTWLLHHAGLYPTHLAGPIAHNLFSVSSAFLLPLLVIAAVTATFVRYASSVLGGFLYAFAIIAVAAWNFPENMDVPSYEYVLGAVFFLFPLAALLVQYSKRKTMVARLILVSMPLVLLVLIALAPVSALTQRRYPNTSVGSLTFDSSEARQQPAGGRLMAFKHKNQLEFPVNAALNGLPATSWVEPQRVQLTLDAPGVHYVGPWTSTRGMLTGARSVILAELPESVLAKLHDKDVAVHMTLGVQVYNLGTPYNVTATEKAFPIPNHGSCTASVDDGSLACRFPYSNSGFLQVQATVHDGNCLNPGPATAVAHGNLTPTPGVFGFTPVEVSRTQLIVGDKMPVPLCSGTPVTFTPVVADKYARMTLEIPAVKLDPYVRRYQVQEPQAEQAVPPAK